MYAITSMIKLGLNNRYDICPEKQILNIMTPNCKFLIICSLKRKRLNLLLIRFASKSGADQYFLRGGAEKGRKEKDKYLIAQFKTLARNLCQIQKKAEWAATKDTR